MAVGGGRGPVIGTMRGGCFLAVGARRARGGSNKFSSVQFRAPPVTMAQIWVTHHLAYLVLTLTVLLRRRKSYVLNAPRPINPNSPRPNRLTRRHSPPFADIFSDC